MSKRAWIGLGAAVLVVAVAGGGYALLLQSAKDAVEGSIAQFRASLPAGATFEYGGYEIDLLERSVVLSAPRIEFNGAEGFEEMRAAELRLLGVELEEEATRIARLELTQVRVSDTVEPPQTLTHQRFVAEEIAVAGQPKDLAAALEATRIARTTAEDVVFTTVEGTLRAREVVWLDIAGGRIGETREHDVEMTFEGEEPGGRLFIGEGSVRGINVLAFFDLFRPNPAELSDEEAFDLLARAFDGITGLRLERLQLELDALDAPIELAALRLAEPQIADGSLVGAQAQLVDLSFPLGADTRAQIQQQVPGLPLRERIVLSTTADQAFDVAAQRLDYGQSLTVHELLDVEVAFSLGNLSQPLSLEMSEADVQAMLLGATLTGAQLTVTDLGFLKPALSAVAAQHGMSADQLVEAMLGELALNLQPLQVGPTIDELLGALQAFLTDTGRLQVSLMPEEAVPLPVLGAIQEPNAAVGLLRPRFTATPD